MSMVESAAGGVGGQMRGGALRGMQASRCVFNTGAAERIEE